MIMSEPEARGAEDHESIQTESTLKIELDEHRPVVRGIRVVADPGLAHR
jgi:hypothetical protein